MSEELTKFNDRTIRLLVPLRADYARPAVFGIIKCQISNGGKGVTNEHQELVGNRRIGGAILLAALVPVAFTKDSARRVKVVKTYAHDPDAFCQGLVVDNGQMWEGTGQYGKSTLRAKSN